MTNKEKIVDLESGEETLVPMTTQEKSAYEKEKIAAKLREEELLAELQAKAQAKAALLDRLGITEDEAKLLLG